MIKRLMPSRKAARMDESQVVCDLDDLIAQPYAFIFQGKKYVIRPVTLEDFAKSVNVLSRIDQMSNRSDLEQTDVIQAYTEFFQSVCSELTVEVVSALNAVQLAALAQLIVDVLTGRVQKKNTLTNAHPATA